MLWRCKIWTLAWLATGCMDASMDHDMGTTPPIETGPFHAANLALPKPVDLNPDPAVIELQLEAKPATTSYLAGKSTAVWTYNGSVPGPLIEAKVGDRLIVHLKNSLPEATTIHWHGLRVPSTMDGGGMMGDAIPPGGSFTYDFMLPDAGLFWYHPHAHTDVQVEKGLYGAILVHGNDAVAAPERVLMLDDVLLDDDGQLGKTSAMTQMLGREGNVPLVNGQAMAALTVRSGTWERWRLVNTANARYLRLSLAGAEFVQIGTDGGWLTAPVALTQLQLVPGERADVLVHFTGQPGSVARLTSASHDRGHGIQSGTFELLEVRLSNEAAATSPNPTPAQLATIAPLPPGTATQKLELGETMSMASGTMTTVFSINGQAWPKVTPLQGQVGRTDLWTVANTTEMDHPFHLHGFFFQPLTLDGKALPLAWKDTIDVPAKATLTFAVRYDDHGGMFPFHCHILEHAEAGMMGMIDIAP